MEQTALDEQLAAAEATIELMRESMADITRTMMRDEAGWDTLGSTTENLEGFNHAFRKRAAARNLIAMTANPLIKSGVSLRAAYIWGDGCDIAVRDKPESGQDVNAIVQAFLEGNQSVFVDTEARIALEYDLARVGEVALCLPTDPITGRVRVRKLPVDQITRIACDPEDEIVEQLYLREWLKPGNLKVQRAWYPALGYRPDRRDRYRVIDDTKPLSPDNAAPIQWGSPVRFVRVNRVGPRGLGDVFAAVPWADAYKRFLEDWSKLMASLARFAWQVKTRGDRTAQAAARMAAATGEAGQGVAMDPNSQLEAVSKSGATIDANSGRPLAVMVASALDLPVTTLLGDPGSTGARAVAEQVSDDSWAAFDIRRQLWRSVIRDVCGWVIDSAVTAPAGPLRGTLIRDGDRQIVRLPDEDGRTIEVTFPARDSEALLEKIKAIQIVDQSDKIPPLTLAKAYLSALGVQDIDEVLELITDADGNFVPLDVIDSRTRQKLRDAGEDA